MRVYSKLALLFLAVLFISACSCKTKKVGPGGSDFPPAEGDGILKDINFGFDSYQIDSVARGVLQANAEWLRSNPSQKVQVEGHCDERGTNEYNMVLGANRASSTKKYLSSLGISESRMSTVSYGEEMPLDPSHGESSWARNRRAHFRFE